MKALAALVLLFSATGARAARIDVNSLNRTLKNTHATWTAKANPMTRMSEAEAKMRLGLERETEAVSFEIPTESRAKFAGPSVVDWRDNMGGNWVSPILDQANCGSCVAFAAIGALETQYKIASGFAGFNIKLSPQHLFSCGGGSCYFGWRPENAATYLRSNGVPDESCMPYVSGATGDDVECKTTCADAPRRSVRIASFTTPTRSAKNLDSLRQALQRGPLVTTLGVYEDFMAYGSGVYKHTTGSYMGGHAISIIGYDDDQRALIIRNSWGESWGQNGFAYVSYDDTSGVGDMTWGYDIPSMNGAVSVGSPIDYTYATGSLPLLVDSTFANTDSLDVSVFNAQGQAVWNTSCPGAKCDSILDVSKFADGRYEVQAAARGANGQTMGQSTHQFFYVSNQKPNLSLTFTGANGTDLNKGLKGRMEVRIAAASNTVPMNSVEFHYRGPDGKDVKRTAAIVVSGMTMGWRTNLVPNGAYEIWMVGRVKTNALETVIETPHQAVTVAN